MGIESFKASALRSMIILEKAPNMKKPRAAGLTGVDGGLNTHAVGLRKGREYSSHSALEASDCFQFYRGFIPGDVQMNRTTED